MSGKKKLLDIVRDKIRFKHYSLSTQNQAFAAILFLYCEILGVDISEWNIQALRAQERKHIPVVLTKDEVQKVLDNLNGTYKLMVTLMYGCGLRMSELLNLRVKDIDFGFDKIYIWNSKSLKDRTIPLPLKLKDELKIQIKQVQDIHNVDIQGRFGNVYIPFALSKKYKDSSPKSKLKQACYFAYI